MKRQKLPPKVHGALLSIVGVLASAAEVFEKPDVGSWKLRKQADRVLKRCAQVAEGSVYALDPDGDIGRSTARHIRRAVETYTSVATRHLERREMYCAVFVGARLMAAWYALNSMVYRHKLDRSWRMLEQVAFTMVAMITHDLQEEEEKMFKIAERFEEEMAV